MTENVKSIFDNGVLTVDLSNQENLQNVLMQVQTEAQEANAEIRDASKFIGEDSNGNTTLDLSNADTHELRIIPNYSSDKDKKLTYVILALTPKFSEVLNSKEGLEYLQKSYISAVLKKIRDNVRNAITDKREYILPKSIADFLSSGRQSNGASEEFKREISEFVKLIVEKFGKKYAYAKPMMTNKNMLLACENEAFAKSIYPFLIAKAADGSEQTIIHRKLEQIRDKFAGEGKNTAEVERMLATRLTAEFNNEVADDESDNLEDLF